MMNKLGCEEERRGGKRGEDERKEISKNKKFKYDSLEAAYVTLDSHGLSSYVVRGLMRTAPGLSRSTWTFFWFRVPGHNCSEFPLLLYT